MPKFTVTLKQHTPLIHFQAEQEGATLRATELKPKLDKFLIKNAFKNDFDKYKEFLIGYPNKVRKEDFGDIFPLDYKVFIKLENRRKEFIEPLKSLYMGNMDNKKDSTKEPIKAIFNEGDIEIEFFSFCKDVIDKIEMYIGKFFSVNNFGARQNKGFGSFYIKDDENLLDNIKEIKEKFLLIKYNEDSDYSDMMKDVAIIYALMKTGVNFPDYPIKKNKVLDRSRGNRQSYHKSFIFQYMLNKNIGNEKKFIKEKFFRKELRIGKDGQVKKYVRGLLGTCDGVTFRDKRYGKIDYHSEEIERFKSPITFKIVDNVIAIIPEEILVYNKEFTISDRFNRESIYIPSKNEFELKDFLFSFADYFNNMEVKDVKNRIENSVRSAKKRRIEKVMK